MKLIKEFFNFWVFKRFEFWLLMGSGLLTLVILIYLK